MAVRQSPLVGLQMDEVTAKYVGTLEGTIAAYAIQEAKFRALLELITGETWEDVKIDHDGKRLQGIAVDALVASGVDRVTAKVVVNKRWNAANLPTPTPVSKAVPLVNALEDVPPERLPSSEVTISKGEMKQRLENWKQRNKDIAAQQVETES